MGGRDGDRSFSDVYRLSTKRGEWTRLRARESKEKHPGRSTSGQAKGLDKTGKGHASASRARKHHHQHDGDGSPGALPPLSGMAAAYIGSGRALLFGGRNAETFLLDLNDPGWKQGKHAATPITNFIK